MFDAYDVYSCNVYLIKQNLTLKKSVAPDRTLHEASVPLRAVVIGAGTIYTDGSYQQHGNLANFITKTTTSTFCAAIVVNCKGQEYEALRMDFTYPHPSAYIAELVAAAGAYQGSQPGTSIRSDCKAGISTILKAAGCKRPKGPQGLITTFLLKPHVPRSLTWVGSHPDLKPEKVGQFEDEDFNIYSADKLAGKESLIPTRDGRGVKSTTVINGDDIITDLLSVNRFTIRYINTPARPLLKRIEEVVHTNRRCLQGTARHTAHSKIGSLARSTSRMGGCYVWTWR